MQAEYGMVLTLEDHNLALVLSERDALDLVALIAETVSHRRGDMNSSNGEVMLVGADDGTITVTVKRHLGMSII